MDAFASAELGGRRRASHRTAIPPDSGHQAASGNGYRSCLGLVRLGGKHTPGDWKRPPRAPCTSALYSFASVDFILRHHLENEPLPGVAVAAQPAAILHQNIRGAAYFEATAQ